MKFGKSIGSQQDDNLNLHYVDYKMLKKCIKDVVEQLTAGELNEALAANKGFEDELNREIVQVNTCFAERQRQLLDLTAGLAEEFQSMNTQNIQAAPSSQATGGKAAGDAAGADEAEASIARLRPEAFRRLVGILGEVDQLRKYAVWNAVAVVKILKKRRKQTRFGLEDTAAERAAWLSRQSFFSGSDFAELHAAIESLGHMLVYSELAPDGGAQRLESQPQAEEPEKCPICLNTISDMIELDCSHRFCWRCYVLGPIAHQPGEYRIQQCPICRKKTSPVELPKHGGGVLTRFLHTYYPKESEGRAACGEAEEDAEADAEQAGVEVRDIVGELVRALLSDTALQRPARGSSEQATELAGGGGSAGSAAPTDFFQTLPQTSPQEKQLMGAAQKLQWLQLASTGDSFALDGTMYCSLCSEPLLMEAVVTTPCKHYFHRVCVSRLEEPKCPLCTSDLPFEWYLPSDHPCAEHGFHVVPMHRYRPLFPGGPSRGSCGYPLHRPPPVTLRGPGGTSMRSYLHRIVPMGTEEDLDDPSMPLGVLSGGTSPERRTTETPRDASSGSDSSSEESNSEDGGDRDPASPSRRCRAHAWAYSATGKIRLMGPAERLEAESTEVHATFAASAPADTATGSSAASSDAKGPSASVAGSAEHEQRNPPVLLIGRHL